jgi:hypothetical protein
VRKEEQRRMARRAWCWRVHSAVTQKVSHVEVKKPNIHNTLLTPTSGQLPFLGSENNCTAMAAQA